MTTYTSTIVVPNEALARMTGPRPAETREIERAVRKSEAIARQAEKQFMEWSTPFTLTA